MVHRHTVHLPLLGALLMPCAMSGTGVEAQLGRWFDWTAVGGGKGYVKRWVGAKIHYGDVELQASDRARVMSAATIICC